MLEIMSSPVFRQYGIVLTVNLCVITMGLGLAWSSPVLIKLADENQTILPHPITVEEGSWIVSVGVLVGPFTILLPGILLDAIGRKYCVLLSGLPKFIGALMFIFASDAWVIIFGRALIGIGDFFLMTVVPIYASEIASKELRGSLGTFFQILCSLGILMMLSIGPFVSYLAVNVLFISVITLVFIPVIFLPDTPYFLYAKGRKEEAVKVLTFLRGSETAAYDEIKEYALPKTDNKDEQVDKKQLFKNKIFLKSMFLVVVIGGVGQLSGYNAVTFYLQTVLESTGTNISDEIGSVIIGCIQVIASIFTAIVLSDRFGRKPILITTFFGMSCGMIALGVFFHVRGTSGVVVGFMNVLPLISLALIVVCFSAGYGSVYWPLISEMFDGPGRSIGVTASVFTSGIMTFVTTKYFAALTNSIGPSITYWMFGGICVLFSLFIWSCVPETKGKSFAEIQKALGAPSVETQEMDLEKK